MESDSKMSHVAIRRVQYRISGLQTCWRKQSLVLTVEGYLIPPVCNVKLAALFDKLSGAILGYQTTLDVVCSCLTLYCCYKS